MPTVRWTCAHWACGWTETHQVSPDVLHLIGDTDCPDCGAYAHRETLADPLPGRPRRGLDQLPPIRTRDGMSGRW